MLKAVGDFVHELGFADLPPEVVEQARRCLLDLVGVAITGHGTELSRIVRDFAAHNMAGGRRACGLTGESSAPPAPHWRTRRPSTRWTRTTGTG